MIGKVSMITVKKLLMFAGFDFFFMAVLMHLHFFSSGIAERTFFLFLFAIVFQLLSGAVIINLFYR